MNSLGLKSVDNCSPSSARRRPPCRWVVSTAEKKDARAAFGWVATDRVAVVPGTLPHEAGRPYDPHGILAWQVVVDGMFVTQPSVTVMVASDD